MPQRLTGSTIAYNRSYVRHGHRPCLKHPVCAISCSHLGVINGHYDTRTCTCYSTLLQYQCRMFCRQYSQVKLFDMRLPQPLPSTLPHHLQSSSASLQSAFADRGCDLEPSACQGVVGPTRTTPWQREGTTTCNYTYHFARVQYAPSKQHPPIDSRRSPVMHQYKHEHINKSTLAQGSSPPLATATEETVRQCCTPRSPGPQAPGRGAKRALGHAIKVITGACPHALTQVTPTLATASAL